jgi:hypothetical protein
MRGFLNKAGSTTIVIHMVYDPYFAFPVTLEKKNFFFYFRFKYIDI